MRLWLILAYPVEPPQVYPPMISAGAPKIAINFFW